MDCNECQRLLEADSDGELGLSEHVALHDHVRTCPGCARQSEYFRDRRTMFQEKLRPFVAPAHLVTRIRTALPLTYLVPRASSKIGFPFWPAMGLAASFGVAILFGFAWGNGHSHVKSLLDEAVSDHIRSLQAGHLTDVASTDRHTVKPWFAGRLDFSPPVVDLVDEGFPLVGGRLERIDGRSGAALVFRRRQHVINLFIWPATTAVSSSHRSTSDGYVAETWSQAGLNFLAISEISSGELDHFSELFRAQAP